MCQPQQEQTIQAQPAVTSSLRPWLSVAPEAHNHSHWSAGARHLAGNAPACSCPKDTADAMKGASMASTSAHTDRTRSSKMGMRHSVGTLTAFRCSGLPPGQSAPPARAPPPQASLRAHRGRPSAPTL
eukprot:scaffold238767_cov31-Tisochrysis_lutea.AAC.1